MSSSKAATELKTLRVIILKWSQLKLAKQMGVCQSVISAVENELVIPSKKFKEKLERVKRLHKT